ncbi:ornithine cyclodeaminase [Paecilomyces variotii]|uniref:Ornithine cyclodeaminase n=1 Tax=Byssochlamys spectabilis TaxID=264951 RepID=A0A443HNA0_BYSSP|nr:ornithine cyclodeaminase [Paecilomyces variotii]KAJ9363409.1 hypothetical protein DTO280E4_2817 [Paecilomyces variotii]RWQ93296.1 ornithine cyclodeaminase [Paecilomyces variotii]
MENCTVLGDKIVQEILISLSKDEICEFLNTLATSLLSFSTSDERSFQPEPAVVARSNGVKTLFRAFTSPEYVGTKIIVDPSTSREQTDSLQENTTNANKPTLHGLLILCNKDGLPRGIINADEITAHRTSLSVMIPFSWRERTAKIVVFGAGKQALWHIRLALALRGDEIKQITIVNRSAERSRSLVSQIREENQSRWKSSVQLDSLDITDAEFQRQLEDVLATAHVVFCTTPSKVPLFPARFLRRQLSETGGCYVSSIGSWQPSMIELDPELLRDAVTSNSAYNPRGGAGGAVIVDDREVARTSSGELIQSQLKPEQLVEVGEVINLKDDRSDNEQLENWLGKGFVIYKSVGVSMTDLAAGTAILSLASRRGKGLSVQDF